MHGAPKEDYQEIAPPGSFIHEDDFGSVRELAEYLRALSKDRAEYNRYFTWVGTGAIIPTFTMCRICAMLHAPKNPKYYSNLNQWWEEDACLYDTSYL